mgnify:FL=1
MLAGASTGAGFTWESEPPAGGHGASGEIDALTGGDVDGDGKADVMLIRELPGPDVVHLGLAAKGATARFRLVQVAPAPWLNEVATADFNADGKTDLQVGSRWARGRGDGQFDAPATAAFPCADGLGHAGRVVAADLDGDGRDDLLCSIDDPDNTTFELHGQITVTPAEDVHGWVQADVSGDGVAELVRVEHLAPGYRITVVSTLTQQRTTFAVTTASTEPSAA